MLRRQNLARLARELTPIHALAAAFLLLGLALATAGIGAATQRARDLPPVGLGEDSASASLPSSEAGVEQLAGGPADRCVYASPGRKLCRWQLDGRLVRPITRGGVGDGGRVRLLCELPTGGEGPGACQVHPIGETALPAVAALGAVQDPYRALSTLASLGQALGDVPERCTTLGFAQSCTWPLAGDAGSGSGEPVLRCLLPLDGSPRADDSCEVTAPE